MRRSVPIVVAVLLGGGEALGLSAASFQPPILVQPSEPNGSFGFGLASGDVNGDGIADLVVGAVLWRVDNKAAAGRVFIFFGGSPFDAGADLVLQAPTPETDARFGWAIALADMNGDGHKDILVSAPFAQGGASQGTGAVYLFFGGALLDAQADLALESPSGLNPLAHFGWSLAAGDINGDGREDVLVGAENRRIGTLEQAGQVFVYEGRPSFIGALTHTLQAPTPQQGAAFGSALAVGDVTGDGVDDVFVGAPNEDVGSVLESGRVHLFFGGASFDTTADAALQQPVPVRSSGFGQALAVGDVTGDGIEDVLVGAPHPNFRRSLLGASSDPGEVYLFRGGQPFDSVADLKLQAPSPKSNDGFGGTLAVGEATGDGRADILVGSLLVRTTGVEGSAYLFEGGTALEASADATFLPSSDPNAQFSIALAIEDVNGDGRGDVLIGSVKPGTLGLPGGQGKVYIFLAS